MIFPTYVFERPKYPAVPLIPLLVEKKYFIICLFVIILFFTSHKYLNKCIKTFYKYPKIEACY